MAYLKYFVIFFALFLTSCKSKTYELGTEKNPIKMYFVPSGEVSKIITHANTIEKYLENQTKLSFDIKVPMSYAAVIEAIRVNECDIAWLGTFAYILAHDKYGADVALTILRRGQDSYRGQFIALANSKINSLDDIKDKSIAYTDKSSTSGYIYPAGILKQRGIKPKTELFAGGHPQAVSAVYDGRVDVGCSYWSQEEDGIYHDARELVSSHFPDIFEKTKIIGFTDWIPNDTVVFRKNFSMELKGKIVDLLINYSQLEEGKKALYDLYHIDGFMKSTDKKYDIVRKTVKSLGIDLDEIIK